MTENEPQQPQQQQPRTTEPSPWARDTGGSGHDQDHPRQGAGGSEADRAGAVQGGPAGTEWAGGPGAVQGGDGTAPGVTDRGAVQGGTPVAGTSFPGVPFAGAPGPAPEAGWSHGAQDPGQPGQTSGQMPGQAPGQPGPYYLAPGAQVSAPPRPRGRGKVVAGVAALVLAVGGVAGGVGGYYGYQAAEDATVVNALDAPPPARQTGGAAEGSVEQVAQKVLPVVVQVQVSGGAGSGIVISSDGSVLTNNHVVESAANGGPVRVQFQDGSTADAEIVGRDPSSDLAVVKARGVSGLPTAELGTSSDLRIGQEVVAIGSPFDLNGTVTSGIVSSLNRPVRAGGENGSQSSVLDAIQTDAAINPGNSGGPLVDMQGRIIGVNSAIYSPNSGRSSQAGSVGIGFAIPIDQARRTAKELSENGRATQTVLGVQVTDADRGGALIREVSGGGAAEQAGVKAGDVVTK
ncbi:trypsin-like peptidase domain-containing protein, partial [Saccharothrix coeruleofusca]